VHRNIQISGGLLASIMVIFMQVSQLLYLPTTLIKHAGQEAWLAVIISGAGGALIGLFAIMVALRHPTWMPAQMGRQVMGRWLGGLMGLIYGGFILWIYVLVLRDIIDFVEIVLLRGTPGLVIAGLMAIATLYAAWEGLESIARISFVVTVAMVVSVTVIPLLIFPEVNVLHFDPFLWQGLRSVFRAGAEGLPWFGESLIVMTLVPALKEPPKAYRWFLVGATVATVLLAIMIAVTTMVFGPDLSARFTYPVYYLAQQVTISRSIERIEVILITVWISGMFVKLAMCLYAAATAVGHSFGLRSHRWPAIILMVAAVALTHLWRSSLDLAYMTMTRGWMLSTLALQIGIPAVLLVASLLHSAFQRKGATHA
jgi:spore germination protein KB